MTQQKKFDEKAMQSRVKTRMLHWFDRLAEPRGTRSTFARSIDVMLDELPNRDNWFETMTVALGDTESLDIASKGQSWRVFPCADLLAVTTVVPGWSRGWRSIISDEACYHKLTWFLHFARQYVHRSHVAKVLMIAWDRERRTLHPFGHSGMSSFYGPVVPAPTIPEMLSEAVEMARAHWGAPRSVTPVKSVWADINTLDPSIHQAIFHFIRAQSLWKHEFELEAVVALDCALQAIKSLLVHRGLANSATTRAELCTTFGLSADAAQIATEGQFLRNMVGAHAGGWRWWDTGDVTEALVPALSKVTRRALAKAAALERGERNVDPHPNRWSQWFLVNFDMLWDTVWFDR